MRFLFSSVIPCNRTKWLIVWNKSQVTSSQHAGPTIQLQYNPLRTTTEPFEAVIGGPQNHSVVIFPSIHKVIICSSCLLLHLDPLLNSSLYGQDVTRSNYWVELLNFTAESSWIKASQVGMQIEYFQGWLILKNNNSCYTFFPVK